VAESVRLERGGHPDPTSGTCLMERVSVIAGERFTDRPRCSLPALAVLAQQVNDRVSDAARQDLLPFAPALATSATDDPRASWALVEVCARQVLAQRPDDALAARLLRRASRARVWWTRLPLRGRPGRIAGLRALPDLAVAFHRAAALSGPAGTAERDAALLTLLGEAVAAVTGVAAGRALPAADHAPVVA
jgi:hypothetical protein